MGMAEDKKRIGDFLLIVGGKPKPDAPDESGENDELELQKLAAEEFMKALRGNDPLQVIKSYARFHRLCCEYGEPGVEDTDYDGE